MRSHHLAAFATLFFSAFSFAQINYNAQSHTLSIDASGRNGSDGSSGSSSYYSRGNSGQDGDNGADGGNVILSLQYSNATKTKVDVAVQIPNQGVVFKNEYSLSELKNITIDAQGGNGGDGGDGGRGSDGRDGSDGWAGCPPSTGSNGQDGDDGGSGGHGGDAGRGGQIQIFVPENQSELLMLVKSIDNSAGRPGDGGSGGRGGDGGDGGDGGRNTCEEGGSSAWDGNDGSDGRTGSSGSSGRNGQDGSHAFVLSGTSYPEMYNLVIQGVEYQDENADGIIEYGEKINILKMKLVNTSSMPSPKEIQIVGLNGLAPELMWVNSQSSLPIKSLAKGEVIEIQFPAGSMQLQAMEMKVLTDTPTRIPLGYEKAALLGFFNHLPGAAIKRVGTLSVTRPKEKMYWAQTRTIDITVINQTSSPIGKGSQRPVWLKAKLKSKVVTPKDIKLSYEKMDVAFDNNGEALIELAQLNKGANAIKLDLVVGNRSELFAETDLEFSLVKSALLPSNPASKQVVDIKSTSVSIAKDLLAEAHSFTLPVKEKIYCTFGPKNSRRRVKQIVITKQANSPNVEFNLTLSQLVFFKKQLPKVYQGRHDLSSYLEDLQAKKLTGPKLVEFLNRYVKPGTATTLGSSQPQWVISNCFEKTKK
tara:strand:- start:6596 stop:8530 length:1935 start_codon:yes stop_codon:yes gene_type:complete